MTSQRTLQTTFDYNEYRFGPDYATRSLRARSSIHKLYKTTLLEKKSRTERPRKTKIGTEVAHLTRDSDTTFKLNRSKVNLLLMS